MKIGVITFHASHNYGSMLQAWALQTYLENQGLTVEIVNYRSIYQKKIYYKPFELGNKYSMASSLKRLLFYPSSIKQLYKKWHLFEDFMHTNFHVSDELNTIDQLQFSTWHYDLLICGSDQIWNTNAPDATEAYYGNFINKRTRKISYAASFGQYPDKVDISSVHKNLKNFDAISVREEKSKDLLIKYGIADDVKVVCDPTLLLDAHHYDSLIDDEPIIKESYIFFYTPVGLPLEYFSIAEHLAEQTGLPVITERAYYPKDLKPFKHIKNHIATGPREFLNLVKNATYVIGGSFHLQVFSILFQKDFYCINGDKDSRTNGLLSKVGLQNRIISLEKPDDYVLETICYGEDVKKAIFSYRKSSMEYLSMYLS